MSITEQKISSLVSRQLPDFIRAEYPQFQRFIELYYSWLEDETKGNTVFHIMNVGKYRDIDETLDPFIRLFKEEILPFFPEKTELDLVKILKGARDFYSQKGSEASIKWLFRVLFDEEVEIYYPKQQILVASDGKWKQPYAFQLTLSEENAGIDVNLLEKRHAEGSISHATCVIESANRTIDKLFGHEIVELYVSGVQQSFLTGENLEIVYEDENGVTQTFAEKIIGSISSIKVDSDIRRDPTQKKRGLLYNVGDPIVVFGGLTDSDERRDAVAVVGNVTIGSIEGLFINFPGYGYREFSNTETTVFGSVSDDPEANVAIDIRVAGVNTSIDTTNTNNNFKENIVIDKMPIEYTESQVLSDSDWPILSGNAKNILVTIDGTPGSGSDKWFRYEDWYGDSDGSYETANIVGKILTANTSWVGTPLQVVLYAVQNSKPLSVLVGTQITTSNSNKNYTVDSIDDVQMELNLDSQIVSSLNYETLETGGIAIYNVYEGGFGFRQTPTIDSKSYFDTYMSEGIKDAILSSGGSEIDVLEDETYKASRQALSSTGQISHIFIDNPGAGYTNGDVIIVGDRGYGFSGYVNVDITGAITTINIVERGEGYFGTKTATVSNVSPVSSVASLSVYGYGEGCETTVETGSIGRVKDVRMKSRGFDYVSAPLVSFKVVDMVINQILEEENFTEGERVWQGDNLETAIFQGIVKSYTRSQCLLRLFNYSGQSFTNFDRTIPFISEGGVEFSIDETKTVTAPIEYPTQTKITGLPNPHFYGNGKARGFAEFFQGLIKYPGFYINTDGFLSSDKKTQDSKKYHNYSYVIESGKSSSSYKNIIKDIVHPLGMSMLSRATTDSTNHNEISAKKEISWDMDAYPEISLISIANSSQVTVTGTDTEFDNVSVIRTGDMLKIYDPDHPLRSQLKIVKEINGVGLLDVESDFTYIGQGKLTTTASSNVVVVSGNDDSVSDYLAVNDNVQFNIAETVYDLTVTSISGNNINISANALSTNTDVVYRIVPNYTAARTYSVIRQEDSAIIPPPPFSMNRGHFPGTLIFRKNIVLSDISSFTFVTWVKMPANDGVNYVRLLNFSDTTSGADFTIYRDLNGRIKVYAANAAQNKILINFLGAPSSIIDSSGWKCVMISANKATNKFLVFYGDTQEKNSAWSDNSENIGLSAFPYLTIGGLYNGNGSLHGGLGNYAFDSTQALDFTNVNIRRKFISPTGEPVYMGADGSFPFGRKPEIYIGNPRNYLDWDTGNINSGSLDNGSAFQLYGTGNITEASP